MHTRARTAKGLSKADIKEDVDTVMAERTPTPGKSNRKTYKQSLLEAEIEAQLYGESDQQVDAQPLEFEAVGKQQQLQMLLKLKSQVEGAILLVQRDLGGAGSSSSSQHLAAGIAAVEGSLSIDRIRELKQRLDAADAAAVALKLNTEHLQLAVAGLQKAFAPGVVTSFNSMVSSVKQLEQSQPMAVSYRLVLHNVPKAHSKQQLMSNVDSVATGAHVASAWALRSSSTDTSKGSYAIEFSAAHRSAIIRAAATLKARFGYTVVPFLTKFAMALRKQRQGKFTELRQVAGANPMWKRGAEICYTDAASGQRVFWKF